MNTVIEQMLRKYDSKNIYDQKNAMKEVMQEIVLYGLSRAGFFREAAFYGGTALRIFYGLDRFSEDLDFSLMTSNPSFDLKAYFPELEKTVRSFGLNVVISEKEKNKESAIRSAFLKGNTKEHFLLFYADEVTANSITKNEALKIKFEIDTMPPAFATFERRFCLAPMPYEINLYAMQSDDKKQDILAKMGRIYSNIPTDCWAQLCIVSQRMDEISFERDVLYHRANDGLDAYRVERNRLMKAYAKEIGNVKQQKYLILSTNKQNSKDARERLNQVQRNMLGELSNIGCKVCALDNNARLEVLHNFFRIGEETHFQFDFDNCTRLGQDFRDAIAPDAMRFCKDHIEIDDSYAKCMTIAQYPQQLDDKFIATLLQQVPYIVLSIAIQPVETEDAYREIEDSRMKTDAEKVRFNRKTVENLDFVATVPYKTQAQEKNIEYIRTEMAEHDQQMFLVLLSAAYFADTLDDLKAETAALKTTAANFNCRFTELRFQQERAFNTAMPYGLRRIASVRTMLTKGLCALVPFNVQEVIDAGGMFYGVNAVSGNLIVGLRSELPNGNGMVLGTSGSGKSLFVKLEILMLYLRFPNAKFYIVDPENEYAPLVHAMGGEVVDISPISETHFNPLDFYPDGKSKILPQNAKSEFVLSLFEKVMEGNMIPGDKSLIDRSLKNIYKPLVDSHYTIPCPTLVDLWKDLLAQHHPRAEQLALAIEIFAKGSMKAFAQPTNVDMSNRLICFNINRLGEQLKPVAMISMLEFINTAVMNSNRKDANAATWVYFDEIYLLLRDEESAKFLYQSWKRFRKYNAYATGITQNAQDCLTNDTACAVLSNSEFVVMLRQTKDILPLRKLYGLSEPQQEYLKLATAGQGILKMGNNIIPFENKQPTTGKVYKLISTKPGEAE